jgi:hypothetical protein
MKKWQRQFRFWIEPFSTHSKISFLISDTLTERKVENRLPEMWKITETTLHLGSLV